MNGYESYGTILCNVPLEKWGRGECIDGEREGGVFREKWAQNGESIWQTTYVAPCLFIFCVVSFATFVCFMSLISQSQRIEKLK